jgi:hypothetical protein
MADDEYLSCDEGGEQAGIKKWTSTGLPVSLPPLFDEYRKQSF